MRDPRTRRVELGPGAGVVAAVGAITVFAVDADTASSIIDVAMQAAAEESLESRMFARRLASMLTGPEAAGLADFGAVAESDDGWGVFLYGRVAASIVMADGTAMFLSGVESATWVDRILPGGAAVVVITPAGLEPPGSTPFTIDGGVVPGGWVRVVALAADRDATAEVPVPDDRFSTAPPQGREPPTEELVLFPLSPDGAGRRAALPFESVAEPTVEVESPAKAPPPTTTVRPLPRLLVFDDGATFGLDGDYVLGREPEIDDAVTEGNSRPITLDDPGGTVSRVHAEIRLVDSELLLIDRGSTNGTHVWDESTGAWDRLGAGEPRVLPPGGRVAVGKRTFVYELPLGSPTEGGP